jgi:hypothetical protein
MEPPARACTVELATTIAPQRAPKPPQQLLYSALQPLLCEQLYRLPTQPWLRLAAVLLELCSRPLYTPNPHLHPSVAKVIAETVEQVPSSQCL